MFRDGLHVSLREPRNADAVRLEAGDDGGVEDVSGAEGAEQERPPAPEARPRLGPARPARSGGSSARIEPQRGDGHIEIAICVGAIVCIASANAGGTSQDLKKAAVLKPGQTKADCTTLVGTGFTFSQGFKEFFLGNSPSPRVSIGIGVNWISPFGPLRIDLAKALVFQKGDDPKLFSFNVGTQF